MKINEIVSAEDKLRLVQQIFNNTMTQIQQAGLPSKTIAPPAPSRLPQGSTKPIKPVKASKPKPTRIPHAAPPKPLPKSKPIAHSQKQLQDQNTKSQQSLAKQIGKAVNSKNDVPMPKSLQPLPGNIISPLHAVDKDFQQKLDSAKKDAAFQKMHNPSKRL